MGWFSSCYFLECIQSFKKKIDVDTDIGLFIESIIILALCNYFFLFFFKNNFNDFTLSDPKGMLMLFLAGPMTVIPLFLYIKGLENAA